MTFRPFDPERFEALRQARGVSLGTPLTCLATTTSTMDEARAAARQGAPSGSLFIAEHQTQGRGRRGNRWFSPPGENLMLSLVLRPSPNLGSSASPALGGLTLAIGLAVRAAVARQVPAQVKWPNDVLVGDRKIAGVLVESQIQGPALLALVVGVGVNVEAESFPPELEHTATSFRRLHCSVTRETLALEFLEALEPRLLALEGQGFPALLSELAEHDALLGRQIRVGECQGLGRGIDGQGGLIIEDPSGTRHIVLAGQVEWR